jgi:3',5'-cyclic AMP phosphodiesterase CpdA
MISLGNHEEADEYPYAGQLTYAASATLRYRGMPTGGRLDANTGLQYFSWNAGPVHYISLNSFYFPFEVESKLVNWVAADLAQLDRASSPWTVVTLHAPWFNSNKDHQGDGLPAQLGLEALFLQHGVSAIFSGHVHAYERSNCVANFTVAPCGPGSMVHLNM